jgi:hypothetical protein
LATTANLYVDQGTTFSTIVDLENQDSTALNLTGYTVAGQMRKSYQSSTAVSFVCSVYGEATNGQIRLQLAPATTTGLRAGRYIYDVEITNTLSGEKFRVLEGIVILNPEITKI